MTNAVKTYADTQTLYINITKEEVRPTYIIVRATSAKFGKDAVMYEAMNHENANRYINGLERKGKIHDSKIAEKNIVKTTEYLAKRLNAQHSTEVYGEVGNYVQTFTTLDVEQFQEFIEDNETIIEGVSLEVIIDCDPDVNVELYTKGMLQINVTVSNWQYESEMFELGCVKFNNTNKPWQALNKSLKLTKLELQRLFK